MLSGTRPPRVAVEDRTPGANSVVCLRTTENGGAVSKERDVDERLAAIGRELIDECSQ